MPKILPQVENIVVVMFENRSLDNLCGWLYSDPKSQPSLFLPANNQAPYNGLKPDFWNPSNDSYFKGQPATKVLVKQGASSYLVPDVDPEETFDNVTYQLYGPQGPTQQPNWPMQGFILNYETTKSPHPNQIMETYTPDQLPVLSALARSYAISDAWFCSVPSQTLCNRAFVHCGTSNGQVNNGLVADPFCFDALTIFNVMNSMGASWTVYSDTTITPSLTRTYAPKLWDPLLDDHFKGFAAFQHACATNALPQYSFIEPSFVADPNDEHPPHDVAAGEQFLFQIWQAVSQSPGWNNILLVITYDEHGGCYDHVLPPTGAVPPDNHPGQEGFAFDRFGVRVPVVLVSPYIQAGTVFRSNTSTPYDHTSILATLRDWLDIPAASMLASKRVAAAPNLDQVLTLSTPRTSEDKPTITPPQLTPTTTINLPPNSLQKSILSGAARRFGMDPAAVLANAPTRQHYIDFFKLRSVRANK
jgi:phospholipase C